MTPTDGKILEESILNQSLEHSTLFVKVRQFEICLKLNKLIKNAIERDES